MFRGRYWTAREMSASNRIQRSIYPFLEASLVEGTEHIPIAFKQYGRLQARMMELVWPSIARYPTTRGFSPSQPVPFGFKLKSQINIHRPPWIRQYSYRLRHRRPRPFPEFLRSSALEPLIDPALPIMCQYFHPHRIYDESVFNRVCTMEWLAGSPVLKSISEPNPT
jgi:asparagine synthase (glutamine-hydrolysing)